MALAFARLEVDELDGAMAAIEAAVQCDPQRLEAYGLHGKAYDPLRSNPRVAAVLRQLDLDVARLTLPDGGRSL